MKKFYILFINTLFTLTAFLTISNQSYSQCTIAVNAGTDQTVCDGESVTLAGASFCSGNALDFDGNDDFIQFPSSFVQSVTDFTFEAWFKKDANKSWSRILDFGSGTGVNMFLTPTIGNSGLSRFAIKAPGGSEQQLTSTNIPLNVWVHYAVTINSSTSTGKFYIDGILVDENTIKILKLSGDRVSDLRGLR